MTLDELNSAPADVAQREFMRCCGSTRWAEEMVTRRPYSSVAHVHEAADRVWASLESHDWLEAFSHHPRIGERGPVSSWSKQEQSGASTASEDTLGRLQTRNHDYERKYGHVFLISATGKTADDILQQLEMRMRNDKYTELHIAAREQARITRLRLDKLLEVIPSEARNSQSPNRTAGNAS